MKIKYDLTSFINGWYVFLLNYHISDEVQLIHSLSASCISASYTRAKSFITKQSL
jgi:hypothetical protein